MAFELHFKFTFLLFFALCLKDVISSPVRTRYFDLGFGYDDKTLSFPGAKKFRFTEQFAGTYNGTFIAFNDFEVGEHSGTHLDAPYHFNEKGRKTGEIPLEKLITKAIVVNASEETGGDAKYRLPASKLVQWEKENGAIPEDSVVLVTFGWSSRYPDVDSYFGGATLETLEYPGLSPEAAKWIVATKKIVGVGVDTPSVDSPRTGEVHTILNGNDIYHLENVNMTWARMPKIFDIIVMPMKLMNGTGAPCRIIGKTIERNV